MSEFIDYTFANLGNQPERIESTPLLDAQTAEKCWLNALHDSSGCNLLWTGL